MADTRVEIRWADFVDVPTEMVPSAIAQKLLAGGFKMRRALGPFATDAEVTAALDGKVFTIDNPRSRVFIQRLPEGAPCTTPS